MLLGQIFDWGVIGVLINHAWSVTNNDEVKTSITGGQYFYTIHLKNAWDIMGQPTWSYNHTASAGNKFTFPVAVGVNKTVIVGKMPIKFSLQYWYYVASPDDFGPQHEVRFQIAPVIPLPW